MNQGYSTVTPISEGFILQLPDWSTVFIVLAGVGCFYFVTVLTALPESPPPEKRTKGRLRKTLITFQHLLGGRAFMGFAFSQAFIGIGMFGYISGSPFILQNIYGVSAQMFSMLFAINGARRCCRGRKRVADGVEYIRL
ncbi:MFS transporter [Bacillus halotolerans]|uniref:MFS transporter n=2 Tax=Bacillus halotolerans TaxID=260554 RepID=UPI002573D81C|nr:MFS transporter [Bacillus halotolerans]MDL5610259.1 MFS transporter [Bacillus halotolerans]